MAIQVLQKFKASPTTIRLPRRVELDMTLSSTEASERCRIVYTLADEHDVTFDDGTKRDEREEKVARAATRIAHRLSLVSAATGTKPTSIQVIQEIFDAVGNRTRDRLNLTIDRSSA